MEEFVLLTPQGFPNVARRILTTSKGEKGVEFSSQPTGSCQGWLSRISRRDGMESITIIIVGVFYVML